MKSPTSIMNGIAHSLALTLFAATASAEEIETACINSNAYKLPDQVVRIMSKDAYQGDDESAPSFGWGSIYIYNSTPGMPIDKPIVVIDGFDFQNQRKEKELHCLLNQENLLEAGRAMGFDFLVLNPDNGTDWMQRTASISERLLEQIRDGNGEFEIAPGVYKTIVMGPSMGGLSARYALTKMEKSGRDHHAKLYMSFDTPHRGANIPVGIQQFLNFFSAMSEAAAFNKEKVDSPAGKQLLVHYYTEDPDGQSTGTKRGTVPNPAFTGFYNELKNLGYPTKTRNVAVTNGSGYGVKQNFEPGDVLAQFENQRQCIETLPGIERLMWREPSFFGKGIQVAGFNFFPTTIDDVVDNISTTSDAISDGVDFVIDTTGNFGESLWHAGESLTESSLEFHENLAGGPLADRIIEEFGKTNLQAFSTIRAVGSGQTTFGVFFAAGIATCDGFLDLSDIDQSRLTNMKFSFSDERVAPQGTLAYDNAPGGLFNAPEKLSKVEPPFGKISAPVKGATFIPTVSALDYYTSDIFHNINADGAGDASQNHSQDPQVVSKTPFNAVYYPRDNQPHMLITAESKGWFISEFSKADKQETVQRVLPAILGLVL